MGARFRVRVRARVYASGRAHNARERMRMRVYAGAGVLRSALVCVWFRPVSALVVVSGASLSRCLVWPAVWPSGYAGGLWAVCWSVWCLCWWPVAGGRFVACLPVCGLAVRLCWLAVGKSAPPLLVSSVNRTLWGIIGGLVIT